MVEGTRQVRGTVKGPYVTHISVLFIMWPALVSCKIFLKMHELVQ